MITLRDIHESPLTVKTILLWLILLPFWYIDLYIFAPSIVAIDDPLLSMSLCFCAVFLSAVPQFIILVFLGSEYKTENGEPKKQNMMEVSKLTVFLLVMWSTCLSFGGFTYNLLFGQIFTFYGFVVTYFTPIVLLFISFVISHKTLRKDS